MTPVEGAHRLFTRDAAEAVAEGGFVPGSNQASVFGVGIAFSVLAIAVMALRLHARLVIVKGALGVDDWLMFAGVVFGVGLSAANMACAWYGAGVHFQDINLANLPYLLQSNYANRLLYVIALCFVKMSLLVFYIRVDPTKWRRWAAYFLMFTVVGLGVATALICIFECWPVALYWDIEGQLAGEGKCMAATNRQTFFEANGILNIVQDICIYVLPLPMIWTLQVPRRQKIALILLFCVGFVALAAACVRYYYVLKLENEENIWFYFADSLNWCTIEVYAAVICGSASTFRVFFKTYAPRLWGSNSFGNGSSKKHPYDQSHSGNFALRTFGQSSGNDRDGKHTMNDIAELDSHSEEAIITSNGSRTTTGNGNGNGVMMDREFTLEVSGSDTSDVDKERKGVKGDFVVPASLRR